MKTIFISSLDEQLNTCPASIALGNFDGVHLGHRALIADCLASGLTPTVFTFSERDKDAITTLEEKARLLKALGITLFIVAPFSLFRDLSCDKFMDYLYDKLACRHTVCGYNFRFGKGAVGTCETLSALAKAKNIPCTVIGEVKKDGISISSTAIRTLLSSGALEQATALLGAPYSITGEVQRGYGIGKTLSFPTMNLAPQKSLLLPHGVYITEAVMDDIPYPAITNIGTNPTFSRDHITYETHLLNACGDFYNKAVTVRFLAFLRQELTFSSPYELKAQVLSDIETARRYHANRPN